ncbi:MAG: DUF4386 family protein [Candidatus Hodarchaeales archaeon]
MCFYLFHKSGYLPKTLALFGLLVMFISLINNIIFITLNIYTPIYAVLILSLSFELVTGLWLVVKGLKDGSETK